MTVYAFYDGVVASLHTFRARIYCGEVGTYVWQAQSSVSAWSGLTGAVSSDGASTPAGWYGKLRKHAVDSQQFQYDDGSWFLHVGDTGYRYVIPSEPYWQQFIDQSVALLGTTKIRTWFAAGRFAVSSLFDSIDTQNLRLSTWQTIEARVNYALQTYPSLQLQLIIYGEDDPTLQAAADGDVLKRYAARYAQARWSAYPNVQWCVINDRRVPAAVNVIAPIMFAEEPWGTLITRYDIA